MTAFNEAQKASDQAKAAALSALARGGSQAMAAYQRGQEQQAEMKRQAATGALQRAAAINAEGAGAALEAGGHLAGTPEAIPGMAPSNIYDRYSQDQARAGTARQQAMADLARGNEQYFSQVNAARPIVEARARAALAERRAKQAAEWNPVTDVLRQLGGVASARALANHGLEEQAQRQAADFGERRGAEGPGSAPRTIEEIRNERLRARTEELGLPAGYAPALRQAPPAQPKMSQTQHRSDVTRRVLKYANQNTRDTFIAFTAGKPETEEEYAMPPARSLAEAVRRLDAIPDKEFRANGVSRDVLYRWLSDYFSV